MTKFKRKKPRLDLKHDAYPYQEEAFEAIKDLEYAAIFHEQGLGKTKIAIDLLCHWLENNLVDSVIIATKKTLVENWKRELSNHAHLTAKVFTANKQRNYDVFTSISYVYLAHFQVLVNDMEAFQRFFKARRVAVILDESAVIKSYSAKITRSYHKLAEFIPIRVIMSGTPYANKPKDIWSQIYFLDSGLSLGSNYYDFEEDYTFPRESYLKKTFANNLKKLNEKISDFTVRETKDTAGISLPNKEYINLYADFSPQQERIYNEALQHMSLQLIQDGKLVNEDLEWVLHRMIRLVQITSNPHLVNEEYNEISGKMHLLKETAESILEEDQANKIIVWTSYIKNTSLIQQSLQRYESCIVHGQQREDENNRSIARFMEDENVRIFIATPQKAGEGLTLTVANHAIFYDRTFSLQHYLQAQDRIHRISQTRNCYVYNFFIKNSIDEYIEKLVQAKNITARLAIGDIDEETFLQESKFDLRRTLNEILAGF